MDYADIIKILVDVQDEYEREMRRAVVQGSMAKAHDALVGIESVERMERRIKMVRNSEMERAAELHRDLRRAFRPRKMDRPGPAKSRATAGESSQWLRP